MCSSRIYGGSRTVDWHGKGVDEMLADPGLPFEIVRPEQVVREMGTVLDTGVDVGWSFGVLVSSPAGSSEIVMESYPV